VDGRHRGDIEDGDDGDNIEEEEEEQSRHGNSEEQELVSPSERRDFIDHQRLPLENDNGDDERLTPKDEAAAWAIRMQAFFCAALLGVSSHFTLHMTGPLKDVLKEVRLRYAVWKKMAAFAKKFLGLLILADVVRSFCLVEHGNLQHTVFFAAIISDIVPDIDAAHRRIIGGALWNRT